MSQPRPAFTLMELLVVIVILSMLTGLIGVAASRALNTARNVAIKAEIDMLHMAIMNYKNEYGSFPPCVDGSGTVNRHMLRLFPRTQTSPPSSTSYLCQNPTYLTPASALVAWLSGYTNTPTDPIAIGDNLLTKTTLFDFDQARQTAPLSSAFPYGKGYFPSGKGGSPYIYINSGNYRTTWPSIDLTYAVGSAPNTTTYTIKANTYRALRANATAEPFNKDTFQILCAGRDEIFSEDANLNGLLDLAEDRNGNGVVDVGEDINNNGVLDPSEDVNGNNTLDTSDDDLCNFWPGTRKDYLDSLNP